MTLEKQAAYGVEPVESGNVDNPNDDTKLDSECIGDYSGAVAKADEVEINLVRKLDVHIMPALWCMYFLYASLFLYPDGSD